MGRVKGPQNESESSREAEGEGVDSQGGEREAVGGGARLELLTLLRDLLPLRCEIYMFGRSQPPQSAPPSSTGP